MRIRRVKYRTLIAWCALGANLAGTACARPVPQEHLFFLLDVAVFAEASADAGNSSAGETKLIFLTAASMNGALTGPGGADGVCTSDANYPGSGTYKALLADGTARIACTTANCSGGPSEHTDWVLAADTSYYRTDATTLLFTTNANGIFDFSGTLSNSFDTGGVEYWSGLNTDWTASANDCSDWGGTGANGAIGSATATDSNAINTANPSCGTNRRLACVRQ